MQASPGFIIIRDKHGGGSDEVSFWLPFSKWKFSSIKPRLVSARTASAMISILVTQRLTFGVFHQRHALISTMSGR